MRLVVAIGSMASASGLGAPRMQWRISWGPVGQMRLLTGGHGSSAKPWRRPKRRRRIRCGRDSQPHPLSGICFLLGVGPSCDSAQLVRRTLTSWGHTLGDQCPDPGMAAESRVLFLNTHALRKPGACGRALRESADCAYRLASERSWCGDRHRRVPLEHGRPSSLLFQRDGGPLSRWCGICGCCVSNADPDRCTTAVRCRP